jgi:superfamily II DNA/RNA helicase
MTSLARRLADHLCERESVLAAFRSAHISLAQKLLEDAIEEVDIEELDWQCLLTWASVLSQSDLDDHVELSLVAAVSALITSTASEVEARQAAAFVLESCSNTPTVKLALERGLVAHFESPARLPALLRRHQRRLQHFIFDDFTGSALPVTDFQEQIWDVLTQKGDTALSAPTSAGKSFVLLRWLAHSLLFIEPGEAIAYIVPSRALIGQTRRSITDMLKGYDVRPRIITMPTLYQQDEQRKTILVMTQERIERLFSVKPNLKLRTLIVDEAHKLGDGPRGVILQRIIDEALSRLDDCRLILAAPHAENAGVLLPRASEDEQGLITASTVSDSRPTVLQNLFWVTPVPRRTARWSITLVRTKEVGEIGEFRLEPSGTGKKKKLAALAYHLGGQGGGNIVFANGAAEAEDVALLLREHVETSGSQRAAAEELLDLARLIKDTVHPAYPLAETLPYGVGIHYGDMPEISRREQERLFDEGKLSFLVCTSTLLEGVNLPCRNLFVWGPRQGRGNPMNAHTFWNLAGRAGRWGREFAGNIFCIDVHDASQWPLGPPARRYKQEISHSGSAVLAALDQFCEFADASDPAQASRENRYFEQILGELVGANFDGRELSTIGWTQWANEEQISTLEKLMGSVLDRISAPPDLIKRHRGINPILVSRFFEYLISVSPTQAESLMPMTPDMHDALSVLSDNLRIIDEHLGGAFGNQLQRNLKARITIDWIRGLPLGRIIRERIEYLSSNLTS